MCETRSEGRGDEARRIGRSVVTRWDSSRDGCQRLEYPRVDAARWVGNRARRALGSHARLPSAWSSAWRTWLRLCAVTLGEGVHNSARPSGQMRVPASENHEAMSNERGDLLAHGAVVVGGFRPVPLATRRQSAAQPMHTLTHIPCSKLTHILLLPLPLSCCRWGAPVPRSLTIRVGGHTPSRMTVPSCG